MKEIIKGGKASVSVKKRGRGAKGRVAFRDRDGIASSEREEEAWGKGTFEVHVMLRLRQGGEERVKTSSAHNGRRMRG